MISFSMKTYSFRWALVAYMVEDLILIRINSVLILRYVLMSNFRMEHNFHASTFKAIKFMSKI